MSADLQQQEKLSTALCVAVPDVWKAALAEMFEVLDAGSVAEAVRTLRLFAIDLLVVGTNLPDEPFWSVVGRIRRARPQLAWILVGDVSDSDEVRARCLGVLMILGPDVATRGAGGDRLNRARIGLAGAEMHELPVNMG